MTAATGSNRTHGSGRCYFTVINAVLLLGQRLRRWPNIKTALMHFLHDAVLFWYGM